MENFKFHPQYHSFLFYLLLVLIIINSVLGGFIIWREYSSILFLLNVTPKISSSEKEILISLSKEMSLSEYRQIMVNAFKESKTLQKIEVGRCNSYPKFIKLSRSESITFSNLDSQTHAVTINQQKIKIESGKAVTISFKNIKETPVLLGYGCDNSLSGAIYITS